MSIEDTINSAKNKSLLVGLLTINIPNIIQDKESRNDMLVYSSIELLSGGTDINGNELPPNGPKAWALPAPSDIIDLHSANYEGVGFAEAKVMQNAMKNGSVASGILEGIKSGGEFFIDRWMRNNAGSNSLLDIKVTTGQGNIYNQYSTASRTSINPNIEMAYRGPNLRQIQFQFRIIPFSESDAKMLYQFITSMREHIYPVTNNTIWKMGYPAKFAISVNTIDNGKGGAWSGKRLFSLGHGTRTYGDASAGNAAAEKIGCVLTDMQVSYGELGTYAGHFDGSPSIANINLTFQENLVSTRESIQQEYNHTIQN